MNCPHHPNTPGLVYCPECRAAEEKPLCPSDATNCSEALPADGQKCYIDMGGYVTGLHAEQVATWKADQSAWVLHYGQIRVPKAKVNRWWSLADEHGFRPQNACQHPTAEAP